MSLLQIQSISKAYPRGERPAVCQVSFSVQPGEFVSLVGESGSGKTTLLRLIAGLETADSGTITLDGQVISSPGRHLPPERRSVGLVFQHLALFPHLTVAQNIEFGIRKLAGSERKSIIQNLLELVNLPNYAARYPHELSGGERQRIALARALAPKPKLLLLDEPFSSLDTHLRESLRDETHHALKQHGTTAILVTHHTHDALALSDRIAVLHQGVLTQSGTPGEIHHSPPTPYVATLFGPCNFLPRHLAPHLSRHRIEPETEAHHLWIRPENLTLLPWHPEATFWGTITTLAYGGDHHHVTLSCQAPNGNTFNVRVCHQTKEPISIGERWAIGERHSP